ncbi:hypothetical protein [Streptomyces sp. NPDC015130]|uniref:hypothetical protein n=1 Tax=Streptomyces sp. NPDC015130 TaxID=3364940 RepID=UPI0036FE1D09
MRKRPSKPYRFAAVENTAIDALPSILATGLLTKLIRAQDGDEVTVEGLCKTHVEGREALTKAMRMLVDKAFVVKFKIQRAASELVEEDGERVAKRGGSWYTTFTVDSSGFTADEVAAMLAEIYDEGNVKAHRVEPEYLDPKKNEIGWTRPTYGSPSVGATRENTEPWPEDDSRPTYGSPTVGPPTVGHPAAHIRKKTLLSETESEDEMPLSGRCPVDARSASTSGSGSSRQGGDAAPATSKPRLSKQERDQVQAVRALLPRELDAALGDKTPPNVSQAILAALAIGQPRERTVQQLVEFRILPRWNGYWAEQLLSAWKVERDAGRTPRAPFGPLTSMLRDTAECGNLSCDDRVDIHLEEMCGACVMRAEDRRASRKAAEVAVDTPEPAPAVPGPRQHQPMPECSCGNPLAKGGSLTVCWECQEQQEAEAAGAALAAQWAAEEEYVAEQAAADARLVAELEQEDSEQTAHAEAEAAERAAAEEERRRLAAEEDARLRAEFAAQHPDLVAFSSQGPAPSNS